MAASPEALERPLRFVRLQPGAFVADRHPRQPVGSLDPQCDPAVRRAVVAAVLNEVVDRALERRPVPPHRHPVGRNAVDVLLAAGDGGGERIEVHVLFG